MTVCVAIKVHDCIVFAADSASSVAQTASDGTYQIVNIWNHGVKVFNLHKQLPIVAMTAGMGNLGPASISTLAKDLRIQLSANGDTALGDSYTIEEVAGIARAFFESKYNELNPKPANPHTFEFWIGGYGSNNAHGEVWKLVITDGTALEIEELASKDEDHLVVWGGQQKAVSRLLLGMDPIAEQRLLELGVSQQDLNEIESILATPLVDPSMPVQDAINLADFLVDVTKRYLSFHPGADVVGGDADIATVTRHEGFKWIKRKHYYPENLNRMETDHVT